MNALELLRDPTSLPDRPVYAVFGDDSFLRREALKAIVEKVLEGEDDELGIARFDGDRATLADVIDEVRTLPFFSKRRVVIVEGADPFVTAHRKELESYVENPSGKGVLVLSVKTWPSNTKLAKVVEQTGCSIECKGPHERELTGWLTHLAKMRHKVQLDDDAARLLIELVGPEVGLLVADLEKLVVYVGSAGRIHRDDVAKMVGAGRIETVWKAIDAATTGRGDSAINHLDGLLAAGEFPVALLAAIATSLLKLYHAGHLRGTRMRLDDACREAGITYPFAIKQAASQHTHLGPGRVDKLPELLLKSDLDLKGASTLPPRVILERLFVQLALPRED